MNRALLLLLAGLLVLAVACETDEADEPEVDDEEAEVDDDEDYSIDDQPDGAAVFFAAPEGGATVDSPVQMEFDVEEIDLTPVNGVGAGEGHLHVFVDHGCLDEGEFVSGPSDEAEADGIYHLSDGQDEWELELEPGDYDLCVQIGDGTHQTFGQTDEIQITVE